MLIRRPILVPARDIPADRLDRRPVTVLAQFVQQPRILDGDDLVLEASAPPPSAILEVLSQHKAEIIAVLRPGRDEQCGSRARARFTRAMPTAATRSVFIFARTAAATFITSSTDPPTNAEFR